MIVGSFFMVGGLSKNIGQKTFKITLAKKTPKNSPNKTKFGPENK